MNLHGRELKIEMTGDDVRLLHRELARIGLRLPDAERQQGFFGGGTREAILRFQADHGLERTGIVDGETAHAINVVVDESTFVVDGTVSSPDRAGVGGLQVEILDRNVGRDEVLATAVTDDRGRYEARFVATSLRERGKERPDLQARAAIRSEVLARSEVRYNASAHETLNMRLPANARALPSEHETLTGALDRHAHVRLADLEESDDRQDVTYLANKSGWDARAVAMAALADQFSRDGDSGSSEASVPASLYYALFRAGLPANPDTLYRTDVQTVERVWKRALEQGIVSTAAEATLGPALESFQRAAARQVLHGPAVVGPSPLTDLLAVSRLEGDQQRRFAELYVAHRATPETLWGAVSGAFGAATAARLQLDGKLGYLTMNNALVMQNLHQRAGGELKDPVELAALGLHRAEKWAGILGDDVPIPAQIPGGEREERRANYAAFLAAQVRVSYPTAAVAEMVRSGDLAVTAPDAVHAFLTEHQGKFEIGAQSVERYLARNNVRASDEIVGQVKRLQRVYQITGSDHAMSTLLRHGLDSAAQVARYDKETFVATFAQELGGTAIAARTFDRSIEVHNAVLNVVVSYLAAKTGVPLGAWPLQTVAQGSSPGGQVLQPAPSPPANAGDVIAYPTLEKLFGEMDFCACEHCRSVLSPAAYLVDLLYFVDRQPTHAGKSNPQAVLFGRRPDIQHLPLTCENTNTALPYIDVVNETLEYFIANAAQPLSLDGYGGHDTGNAASADLLASPQYVIDSTYTMLRGASFPMPLPFHKPLESARRHFEKFEVPLPLAMERLRVDDGLERNGHVYGWRDILMEEIGLSRAEHEILTDATAVPLWRLYGFPDGTAATNVIAGLPNHPAIANAKQLARRAGLTYEDLVALLRTRFVNPNSALVPKLEQLGVPFSVLKQLKDGVITDPAFLALLPSGTRAPDPAEYDGDIAAWVKDPANYARIMDLITLVDPTGSGDLCQFDTLELRRAEPLAAVGDTSTRLGEVEYVRLMRFIRLWRTLGWTIEQTDAAMCALFRADQAPLQPADIDSLPELDAGFLILLPRLGVLSRVLRALDRTPKRDLLPLLACWSDIGTHGEQSLYRQMFLNPQLLAHDPIFAGNGAGEFLVHDPATPKRLADHAEAVRSACNLTGDEYEWIVAALGFDDATLLNVPNLSAIFRRGYLARRMRLSVRELLLLTSLTGLDPFDLADPAQPSIARLIDFLQVLKARSIKIPVALYVVWNQDLSGRSAPDPAQITELARTLRAEFVGIDDQFAATEDPDGNVARARMTLVYGEETTNAFFALLDDQIALDVPYTHPSPPLPAVEAAIVAADDRLGYDAFRHRLTRTGLLTVARRNALQAIPGVPAAFPTAVGALFDQGESARGAFFARHPELEPLYASYIASAAPLEVRRAALLAAFQPELARRRKRQQALQRLAAGTGLDLPAAQALLDAVGAPYPLHAASDAARPAMHDVLAVDTRGLAVQFFFGSTIAAPAAPATPPVDRLDYSTDGQALPANPTPGDPISGVWSGLVETAEAGFFNVIVEADSTAGVQLRLDGAAAPLTRNGDVWRNSNPLELSAGTLHAVELTVENVRDRLSVKWETPKRPREIVSGRYLYPPSVLDPFRIAYTRLLKAASLMSAARLTANELAHLTTDARYHVAGAGWLNALAVDGDPAPAVAAALLAPLRALLDFARLKVELSPEDERLLAVVTDPVAANAGADHLLATVTRWESGPLTDLLTHFNVAVPDLGDIGVLVKTANAFALAQTMGIAPAALIAATTNDPGADTVHDLQTALRARYEADDWRQVVQPINDGLRGRQRDALVAYILHQMRSIPASAHIDTPDKLFEYFLMDVQMEPCMQTSRIRHALSSIQLFTERCLMNLEPRVSPDSINAKQWEWMKRYRVWEANRKVFLFPENWLEPELRDDKSPLFKEIESTLLQGDITEDSAATALLGYLSRLEELAKLEPCALYHVEGDPSNPADDVDHVVARTSGAHRKYYYRRREFGYWTPWEPIKLEIEDDPVMAVLWKGRLLLFWLRILKESPLDTETMKVSGNNTTGLGSQTLQGIQSDAKANAATNTQVTVQAVLCWSEYYDGKWQTAKSSDVNRPTSLGQYRAVGEGAFDRSKIWLEANEEGVNHYLRVAVNGDAYSTFLLYNTHSLPAREEDVSHEVGDMFIAPRYLNTHAAPFRVIFYGTGPGFDGEQMERQVLTNDLADRTVETHHPVQNINRAPFFYEDRRHAFFVSIEPTLVSVSKYSGYAIDFNPGHSLEPKIPPMVLQEPPHGLKVAKWWGDGPPIGPVNPGVIDPAPMKRFVTEDIYIVRGLATTGRVTYGGRQIGPTGEMANNLNGR